MAHILTIFTKMCIDCRNVELQVGKYHCSPFGRLNATGMEVLKALHHRILSALTIALARPKRALISWYQRVWQSGLVRLLGRAAQKTSKALKYWFLSSNKAVQEHQTLHREILFVKWADLLLRCILMDRSSLSESIMWQSSDLTYDMCHKNAD